MLPSGALAAEDLRWLWGPRTAIIGSADYDLLIGETLSPGAQHPRFTKKHPTF
jgi:hypothetical protein